MAINKKSKIKILIIASLALFLVGCGTTSGRLGELPSVPNKEFASKVTVVRISSIVGAVNGYTVALDGKDIFGIGSGEHAEFFVPEGEHYIAVKCFGGWTPTWKDDSLKFIAKPSEHEFFLISPNTTCAEINVSNETETKKHLERSKRIDLEKTSK
jgi:hypothetical protein